MDFNKVLIAIVSENAISILSAFKFLHFRIVKFVVSWNYLGLSSSSSREVSIAIVQVHNFFQVQARVSPLLVLSFTLNLNFSDSRHLLLIFFNLPLLG